ncbi:hypothetical protein Q5V23_004414 [Vibrio fluvialis]|nr:hypothetical protein [Vibrio fluvialis]ELL4670520.1 hypothetical protein [Vibrio fluvialis]
MTQTQNAPYQPQPISKVLLSGILDRIAFLTPYKRELFQVYNLSPNDIRISYINEHEHKIKFMYTNGNIYLFADGAQDWIMFDEDCFNN